MRTQRSVPSSCTELPRVVGVESMASNQTERGTLGPSVGHVAHPTNPRVEGQGGSIRKWGKGTTPVAARRGNKVARPFLEEAVSGGPARGLVRKQEALGKVVKER